MKVLENKITDPTTSSASSGARGRYDELKAERNLYEERARECARLTIPMLFREEGANSSSALRTPWQGLGARGVKVLTAKMLLAVLPPNSPFWRYLLTDEAIAQLGADVESRAKLESGLNQIERAVQDFFEANAHRPKIAETLSQLIVAGNALLFMAPSGRIRLYKLTNYVVHRDPIGTWLEVIAHEKVSPRALPEGIRGTLDAQESTQKTVDVYTWVRLEEGKYKVHQEIGGKVVPGSEGFYPKDACPWIPLRFYAVDGESYGRSYVEEYLGDLVTLELLSQAIAEASLAAARTVYGVKPGGTVKKKELQEAKNNDVITGDVLNDVTTLQSNKAMDLRVAMEAAAGIESRLTQAFLMNSAVQRNAERVTAEEVRYLAQELEDVLGGIYSVLSQEFQLPLLQVVIATMERNGDLPKLPQGVAKPVIVTGLGALGRGQDLSKLGQFLQAMQPFGEQAFAVLNLDNYATRVATALGIDTRGLVKSPEQMDQERQQAEASQMAQQVAPGAMQAAMENPETAQALASQMAATQM